MARAAPGGPRYACLAVRGSGRLQCGLRGVAVRRIMTLTLTFLLLLYSYDTTSQSQKIYAQHASKPANTRPRTFTSANQ